MPSAPACASLIEVCVANCSLHDGCDESEYCIALSCHR